MAIYRFAPSLLSHYVDHLDRSKEKGYQSFAPLPEGRFAEIMYEIAEQDSDFRNEFLLSKMKD